jgi:hypothetical protein
MSFLKLIKKENIKLKIIFQKTLDDRVCAFLRKQQFDVLQAEEGQPIEIGNNFSITTWPYRGGDSFCLISNEGKSLLNINDCEISTKNAAISVRNKVHQVSSKLDILLTQFGYANWVGNDEDIAERVRLANHKLDRIFIQDAILSPSAIIPFASFVFFCHAENFYLNDAQNSPEDVKVAKQLETIQEKIFFMKPLDKITLDGRDSIQHQLLLLSGKAVEHWIDLKNKICVLPIETKQIEIKQLKDSFLKFRLRMSLNFVFMPQLLELLKIIKPINILITDTNKVATLSYLKGFTLLESFGKWHISVTSEVFNFIIQNEFGFNTTHVNGRFRLGRDEKIFDVLKFFIVQELYKNGFGIKHPLASVKHLINEIVRLVSKKLLKLGQTQI